jgi:hypothetical protein
MDLLSRRQVLEWACSLESPEDDPRVEKSNDAVEGYLDGTLSRSKLQARAYVAEHYTYDTPGEAMAYFAAMVALDRSGDVALLTEAASKMEEFSAVLAGEVAPSDPAVLDSYRWTPAAGDAELAEWESLLSRRS